MREAGSGTEVVAAGSKKAIEKLLAFVRLKDAKESVGEESGKLPLLTNVR